MCDFHSIVVRRDGAKAHVAANSHSGAVRAANWRENDKTADFREPFFVEAEWDGVGDFPGVDKITRGTFCEKQARVIEAHYRALADLLRDPAAHAETMLFGNGVFAAAEYADVRFAVLVSGNCPKQIADKLAKATLHASGQPVKSLHPAITNLPGNLCIADGVEFVAPNLISVGGYVAVYGSAKADFPVLAEVGGYVAVSVSAKADFPVLAKVGGNVDVYGSASFPVLAEVGGYVAVYGSAKADFPVLAKVGGYVAVSGSAKADFPVLAKVGGNVAVSGSASFPVLAEVGGYVAVSGSASLIAPKLKKATR